MALTLPEGVFMACNGEHAALLAARRSGRWWFAAGNAATILHSLAETCGDPQAAAVAMRARYPGVPGHLIDADVDRFTARLLDAGLLTRAENPTPWPTPPQAAPAGGHRAAAAGVGILATIAAVPALLAAIAVLRAGHLSAGLRAARAVHRLTRRSASLPCAEHALAAVRGAARWWPGRAACAEVSLATVLLLAASGRRATWVIGARFAPDGAHAWVVADQMVVGGPEPDGWPYHPAAAA